MELEVAELKKALSSMEMELKANRGTIARLAAEAEQHHKSSSDYLFQIQAFVKEKEEQDLIKKNLTEKVSVLKEQNSKKDEDIRSLTQQIMILTDNMNDTKNSIAEENSSLKGLKKEIVIHLFGSMNEQICNENIFKKIKELQETKIDHNRLQEENQRQSQRLREMPDEFEMQRIKMKLKSLEADFLETSALLEEMKTREGKMLKFISNLGNTLRIDKRELGSDLDPLMDAISLRATQLARNEGHLAAEQKTQIYSLQRKIKSLNETVASKNFHLELLKKKLNSMEEQKLNKSDFEKEKDEACIRVKKLMKLVENYKRELAEALRESKELKGRLVCALAAARENTVSEDHLEELMVHRSDLQTLCCELNARIEALQKDKSEGRKAKEKLKEEHAVGTRELIKNLEQKSSTLARLEEHIKQSNIFKQKLSELLIQEVTSNEKSITKVGAKGSSWNTTAAQSLNLSEDEILDRIKILIDANKQNAATAYVLDSALSDMAEGLKVGYHKAAMRVPREALPKPLVLTSFEQSLKNLMSNPQ